MQIPTTQPDDVRETASMPMVLGGFGLRSARRTSQAAYWASWADCSTPSQDCCLVCGPFEWTTTPHSSEQRRRPHFTLRVQVSRPTWDALARGARPGPREPEEIEPGAVRRGWQHNASSEVEKHARSQLFSIRSSEGPLTALPTGRETTIPSHLFRVIFVGKCSCQNLQRGRWLSPHKCFCAGHGGGHHSGERCAWRW